MNHTPDGSGADEIILEGLAAGLPHAEVAVLAGVSTKTIQRRLMSPDFAAEVRRRRGLRVEEVTGRLAQLAPAAISVIGECLAEDKPTVRLRAAEVALTWLTRLRREVDFEYRLSLLEGSKHGIPIREVDDHEL